MKVCELSGALLDLWVARSEGLHQYLDPGDSFVVSNDNLCTHNPENKTYFIVKFRPSREWIWGGPIIERERITVNAWRDLSGEWTADVERVTGPIAAYGGPTALIAAMRAFVASKFGDEVPDEVTS